MASFVRIETSATGSSTTTTGTTSLLAWQGVPPFMVIMLALVVGVAIAANWHSRQPTGPRLALLWGLSLLVLGGTILSMLSIGVFLIPAALAALLAALLGTLAGRPAARPSA
jgi:hypothetical protein